MASEVPRHGFPDTAPHWCAAAWIISASSLGRDHIGQWPVGRSTVSTCVSWATSANMGSPDRASSRICLLGIEQQMRVVGVSRRASLVRVTVPRATAAGSGTARARKRARCSLLRPSRLACCLSISKSGSGSSMTDGGRSGANAVPSDMGPESTHTTRRISSG